MKKYLLIISWLLSLTLIFVGSARLYIYYAQSRQNAHKTTVLQQLAEKTEETEDAEDAEDAKEPDPLKAFVLFTPYEQYKPLFDRNSDMVGWLRIDGTNINYPVMQNPDQSDFYLRHDFYRENSNYGALYVDPACMINPSSDNIIIYGHNMKDRQMFGNLMDYQTETYYQEHPVIHFDTRDSFDVYRIISVFRTTPEEFPYSGFIIGQGADDFNGFVAACARLAFYDTGESAGYGDKLLTLSTCEYSLPNGRLVVVAKKQ